MVALSNALPEVVVGLDLLRLEVNCLSSLQCFATGLDVARERQFVESLEDKLHYFVEECDVLQVRNN